MGIHVEVFRKVIRNAITKPRYIAAALERAKTIMDGHKETMLKNFDDHLVTQEILSGPDGNNITDTLGGRGNLFSYIGFDAGYYPTQDLRDTLRENVFVQAKNPRTDYQQDRILYNFTAYGPNKVDITRATPMPWGTAKSWAFAIEKNIPGLNHYLYLEGKKLKGSHSGPAIQVEAEITPLAYSNTDYLTPILNEFKAAIQ